VRLLLLVALPLAAESTIIRCKADSSLRGDRKAFKFDPWLITGWKIRTAYLFLHQRNGPVPNRVEVEAKGKRMKARVAAERDGWVRIAVPVELTPFDRLVLRAKPGTAFDTRQSLRFIPYPYVEGRR
jgi:hypothetical protein